MKPFNLEKALSGKPVVTREGQKVTELHLFDVKTDTPLCAVIESRPTIFFFTKEGAYRIDRESNLDLFMAEEKRELWVNVYKNPVSVHFLGQLQYSEKGAKLERETMLEVGKETVCLNTVKLWEEIIEETPEHDNIEPESNEVIMKS